ncbi:hypothetical protein LTR85_002922 [Meristemomyces frigidus]|nr:hypothetical protein LTR85_002922 [Meristemomyces frigidus]
MDTMWLPNWLPRWLLKWLDMWLPEWFRDLYPARGFDGDVTGKHIVAWYQKLFGGATTFASILASVMFSVMVLDLKATKPPHGGEGEVRTWSAVGAVLFVLLVLLCQGFTLLLKFHGRGLSEGYDEKHFLLRVVFALLALAFHQLLLIGTLFFCLVVKAYVPAVGWTAFGITLLLDLISIVIWSVQLSIECWSQTKKYKGMPCMTAEQAQDEEEEKERTRLEEKVARRQAGA